MANKPTSDPRRMKWEEEKAQVQYDLERKTLLRLVNLVMERNKDLYDINAERRRYHKG
jgi:hypothetical protein